MGSRILDRDIASHFVEVREQLVEERERSKWMLLRGAALGWLGAAVYWNGWQTIPFVLLLVLAGYGLVRFADDLGHQLRWPLRPTPEDQGEPCDE